MDARLSKFSKALFWDVDKNDLDFDKHAGFVIERVAQRGKLEEWKVIKKMYGLEKIKNTLLNSRYLDDKTLHFFSAYFKIPIDEFRCYTMRQYTQPLWQA